MKFEIKNRWSGQIIYQDEAESLKILVLAAIKTGADLQDANLSGADLRSADLSGADLRSADLRSANLRGANLLTADGELQVENLSGANLRGANLSGANLQDANLQDAYLSGADLSSANLQDANLSGANLRGANLSGANLSGANLQDANLRGANLSGANLSGAEHISDRSNAETSIVPETGGFQGWKVCRNNVVVRLRIPAKALRSNATGRKCRASEALVLEVIGADVAVSSYDATFTYQRGQIVKPREAFDTNRWSECGSGIHFFLTRYEAEHYN